MPESLADYQRRKRNEADEEKGRQADEGEAFRKKQEADREKLKGIAAKQPKPTGMPKQEPGESAGEYGARLRKWREAQAAAQKDALK